MNNIFSYYTKYTDNTDEYKLWRQNLNKAENKTDVKTFNENNIREKAKAITEPLLILDNYEHEKAEDSETFFQTCNIELMSLTSLICTFPIALAKIAPMLSGKKFENKLLDKTAVLLELYRRAKVNIAGKNIPVSKIATVVSSIFGGIFFSHGIKKSMTSQLGLIRKASFDASQNIINNPKIFAIHTPEQAKEIDKILDYDNKHKVEFVDKLKDKVNISSSFSSVNDYNKNLPAYLKKKEQYFNSVKSNYPKQLNSIQEKNAKEDALLFKNLLKNVEHDVLDPLETVEKISNVTYSAMFTGGFLEYLISDKLVDVLKIQNKPLRAVMKFGVPLLTYFLLNKNISDIENRAILAVKYKHLKQFEENPLQYAQPDRDKKMSPIKFLKSVYKDMKDYEKFEQTELPKIKNKMQAKKQINLTKEQEKQAELLQKNTSMVINNQREKLFEQSVGIKSLSETILGPLDIIATAVGGFMGNKLSKKCSNKKLAGMMTGIGAVIAFIPAAIIETKLTKQQKIAEKSSVMLTIKDLDDIKKFADNTNPDYFDSNSIINKTSSIFKEFENI